MNRRAVLKTLISSLAALPEFAHGANSNVNQNEDVLFPRNVPGQEWAQFRAAGFNSPACGVVYRRKYRPVNGLPLGGIDTGRLDVGADSRLGFCTCFNSFSPERESLNAPFLGLTVGEGKWVLTDTHDTYGGYMFAGVRTASEIHYWGHFPVADLEYELPGSPMQVGVRAWSPFLPGDSKTSNTPGAVFEVHLRNLTDSPQRGTLAFSFPGPTQAEAQVDVHSPRERVRIACSHSWVAQAPEPTRALRKEVRGEFSGLVVTSEKVPANGYALGVVGDVEVRTGAGLAVSGPSLGAGFPWAKIANELPKPDEKDFSGSVAVGFELEPRQQKVVRFVLAWYAPLWIGEGEHTFMHMYATRYKSALEVAQFLAREHTSLLRRVLAWQEVVYTEANLPVWLRESLVNILHLFSINSLWAAARPPIGPWCRPEDGLFGLLDGIVEDPAIEPIPDTFYANAPLVFFFPDLALSTLRGYTAYQFASGAAVWIFGGCVGAADGGYEPTAGVEFATPTPGYQTTTNGPCFVDLVDRYWQRTGKDEVLREFYPAVKRNTAYTMSLRSEDGADGIISVPRGNIDPNRNGGLGGEGSGLEWFEFVRWYGMTSHVGGIHLANLRMTERMAERAGDRDFAQQCRAWLQQGSQSMESKMWADGYYLAYNEPKTGRKMDNIFANQLDGEWMARSHGLPGVFQRDRVTQSLATIKRTCLSLAPEGVANMATRDGRLPEGIGYGAYAYFTPEIFMLAMTYLYNGDRETGLEAARRCLHSLTITTGRVWNQPNILDGTTGEMLFGSHYVQNMMLWALPAALERKDIASFCASGGLVDRVIRAAQG